VAAINPVFGLLMASNSGVHRWGAVVLLPPLGVPGGGPFPPGKYKVRRKQI